MSQQSSHNALGQTYDTLKGTVVNGDAQGLQQAVATSSGTGGLLLIFGLLLFVVIAGVIETGTFFGVVFPSNLIVSAAVIAFILMKNRWMVLTVVMLSVVATIIGDHIGYYTGKKLGSGLYDKADTRYFKKKYFIKAQEALVKRGEKIVFVGRFMSFGFLLPTIFGMMQRDKKSFFKLSILSALLWKLSITVPLIVILSLFPSLKIGILLVLCMIIPEIVGWIILLKPQAEIYFDRLHNAQKEIAAIRANLSSMKGNLREILTKLKTSSHDGLSETNTIDGVAISEENGQQASLNQANNLYELQDAFQTPNIAPFYNTNQILNPNTASGAYAHSDTSSTNSNSSVQGVGQKRKEGAKEKGTQVLNATKQMAQAFVQHIPHPKQWFQERKTQD